MSVIIFIIVLALLIFVHELGHFLFAKLSRIRVDEFAIGFPPKIAQWRPKNSETLYSLNLIPFGGFVKIFGEDEHINTELSDEEKGRSFAYKSATIKILVLVGGVLFNWLLAWLLVAISLSIGVQVSVDSPFGDKVEDKTLELVAVLPDSPADTAGFEAGDKIISLTQGDKTLSEEELSVEAFTYFIGNSSGEEVNITRETNGGIDTIMVTPRGGISGYGEDVYAIGVSLAHVGWLKTSPLMSIPQGFLFTVQATRLTALGIGNLIVDSFSGRADFSAVAGPVGIASLVGDAFKIGISQLFIFTAFISINLAIINLIPFPALDGGRILFILIEKIKGSIIKPQVANTLNLVGFGLLILLLLVITYKDIVRLF